MGWVCVLMYGLGGGGNRGKIYPLVGYTRVGYTRVGYLGTPMYMSNAASNTPFLWLHLLRSFMRIVTFLTSIRGYSCVDYPTRSTLIFISLVVAFAAPILARATPYSSRPSNWSSFTVYLATLKRSRQRASYPTQK